MPPEVKDQLERQRALNLAEGQRLCDEAKVRARQVAFIRKETGAADWRCEAALRKIGDPERTAVWLKSVVERETKI